MLLFRKMPIWQVVRQRRLRNAKRIAQQEKEAFNQRVAERLRKIQQSLRRH